jgi:hypothetical protein
MYCAFFKCVALSLLLRNVAIMLIIWCCKVLLYDLLHFTNHVIVHSHYDLYKKLLSIFIRIKNISKTEFWKNQQKQQKQNMIYVAQQYVLTCYLTITAPKISGKKQLLQTKQLL